MYIGNKRVTMLCGHYGSGKTNIAVNLAIMLKNEKERVAIADLDIVNPYFRTKDSSAVLKDNGIRLICSEYANSNIDIPALPQDMYAVTDDKDLTCVLDIGGDDRGALVMGRLAPALLKEDDYEMLLVINKYRPLTPDAPSTVEVMREIEYAAGMRFTGIINNSNLGRETTAEDVLDSVGYAESVARLAGLKVQATTVKEELISALSDKIPYLIPLHIQKNFIESKI